MGRKILSFIITLAVVLAALPVNIKAAETGQPTAPTRTGTLDLSMDKTEENESEGWKWTTNDTGGTLELENCYIKADTTQVIQFEFQNNSDTRSNINIVLKGNNIIETTSTYYTGMIRTIVGGVSLDKADYVIKGEGSLDIRTSKPITSPSAPYGFSGMSIKIESGDIKSNVGFCNIREEFNVQGGSLYIDIPSGIGALDGIYTLGPVNISGGDININAPQCAIRSDSTDGINITGGNIECGSKESTAGIYSAGSINITGNGQTLPQVRLSNKPGTAFSSLHSGNGNISVSGSIVIADSIKKFEDCEKNIENSIVFNGNEGKVYGKTELSSNFELPADTTLSIPKDSELLIKEDAGLTIPEGSSLVNDGKLVLPEDKKIICTGTGYIQKGDDFYTNGDKKYSTVTIKKGDSETKKHYYESQSVLLETGIVPEGQQVKEWKMTPDTIKVINNQFIMPAYAVTAEAVYENVYKLTIIQPSGETTEYHPKDEIVGLTPETAPEGQRFKEWKVIPETLKIENNQFTMPAEDVVIEAVYEKIPVVTEPPAPSPSGSTKPAVTPAPTASTIPPEGTVTPAPPVNTKTPVPVRTSPPASQPPYYIPSAKKHVTIRIMANPAEGGTVTGAVEAEEGDTVTVKAAANTGYAFAGWRENGQQVCADAIYTFKAEENRELIAVFKKDTPAATNTPANTINDKINVTNNIKTVAYVPLPDGWSWDKEDSIKEIPAGGSVTAAAYYNAGMPGNITNNPVIITITRDKCEEDPKVLYTGNDEYAPGCTTDGCGHTECSLCGSVINSGIKVPATGHKESTPLITKAAKGKDGSIIINCTKCGTILNKTVINAVQSVKLSKKSVTYNKKVQRPVITVKDSKGNILGNGTDYTVSFAKGMKKAGIYNIKIIFTGKYQDTINKTYKIVPEGTSVAKTMQKKKGFLIKWKKQAEQVTGYQLQYSTSKKFTSKTTVKKTIKSKKITSKFISGLETGKKYYVRIRTYKNVKAGKNTVKVFSGWSACKNFQVK